MNDENVFLLPEVDITKVLSAPDDYTSDEVRAARRKVIEKGESLTIAELRAYLNERQVFKFEVYNPKAYGPNKGPMFAAQTTMQGGKRAGFGDLDTALKACYNYVAGVDSSGMMGVGGGILMSPPAPVVEQVEHNADSSS